MRTQLEAWLRSEEFHTLLGAHMKDREADQVMQDIALAVNKMTIDRLGQDAAYALGEEAFRAGFEAGYSAAHRVIYDHSMNPKTSKEYEEEAWADYEPSETVKALIS